MSSKTFFISGIDTDIGKTVVTGLIARYLYKKNENVITAKLVQTGANGIADDILKHREIMGIKPLDADHKMLTCPYVFRFPASPHLAAEMENSSIDLEHIDKSFKLLEEEYDIILAEGAGGLCVPLNRQLTILDYLSEKKYPVILVTSPRLGSINHTFLSLQALKTAGIPVAGIIYNMHPGEKEQIARDTKLLIKHRYDKIPFIEVASFGTDKIPDIDFSLLRLSAVD